MHTRSFCAVPAGADGKDDDTGNVILPCWSFFPSDGGKPLIAIPLLGAYIGARRNVECAAGLVTQIRHNDDVRPLP